jgi:DNA end-binding protein Ku
MAPRPYWKGYLKLSLVSCAVALYPATSRSERIAFHWLNRATGNRLRQQMVDSGTGEPVEREDRVRGYQVAKNDYIYVEEEDLDAIEIESSHTIDIERFVPRSEIDPVYLDSPYYLAPNDKVAEEAFAVIREAMAVKGVAGLGRAVIARRERLFALEPRHAGILATSLHYSYEVRPDAAYFEDIPKLKIPDELLGLAEHIIETKMGHFDIAAFEDRYETALTEMIRAKQAGRPVERPRPSQPTNVINLMDALKKSIAAEQRAEGKQTAGEKAKRAPREPAEPAAEKAKAARAAPRRARKESSRSEKSEEQPPAPAKTRTPRKASGRT